MDENKPGVPTDRRDSYRLEVKEGTARLELPPGLPRADLLDLSASGGGLLVDACSLPASELEAVIRLSNLPPFKARLWPARHLDQGGTVRLGVRLEVEEPSALSAMSVYLADRFIEQERALARLLEAKAPVRSEVMRHSARKVLSYYGMNQRHRIKVYSRGMELGCTMLLRGFTFRAARELMAMEASGDGSCLEQGEEYAMALPGSNSLLLMETKLYDVEWPVYLFTFPEKLQRVGLRRSLRAGLGGNEVKVSFDHPRLGSKRVERFATSASADGISFPVFLGDDVIFPGETIPNVALKFPTGECLVDAVIRSMDQGESGFVCGLEIVRFHSRTEAESWKRFVFDLLHPGLRLGGPGDVEAAWTTLERSGYLDEVTKELVPVLKKRFMVSWSRHAGRDDVARYMVYFHGGRPGGTLAANLLYPETWIIHHLGVDKEIRSRSRKELLEIARRLYSGNAFLLDHLAESEFFVLYVNAAKAWNEMMYGRFLRTYKHPRDFIYDGFKVYKCLPKKSGNVEPPAGIEVRCGDSKSLDLLSSLLEQEMHPLEVEAFCYDRERIELRDFSQSCMEQGYERRRDIYFAVRDGRPAAALIAEAGDTGLNVFSLFNRCWLLPMARDAGYDPSAASALLSAAVEHYRDLGKDEFIYLGSFAGEPEGIGPVMEALGYCYVTDVLRWLARRRILPAYLEYINEFLGMMHG